MYIVCDLLDGSERVVRRDSFVEVDEGEHGGLWIAFASHRTFSWSGELSESLYLANQKNGAQKTFFSSLLEGC